MKFRRLYIVLLILGFLIGAIAVRVIYLQIVGRPFFETQGNSRSVRVVKIFAQRGMILDRNGSPLAISTPVYAVTANPTELDLSDERVQQAWLLLGFDPAVENALLKSHAQQQFLYLKRQVPPPIVEKVKSLKIYGLYFQKEYRRYYPDGEAAAQLIGFTNIDGTGQEGLEAYYNSRLAGQDGEKLIVRDLLGHTVEENVRKAAKPGESITLSIDRRVQSIAYAALKNAVMKNKAMGASLVILDVHTGEIWAMVNLPSFNPNNRETIPTGAAKNRSVTDTFEPGSTFKPFAMSAVLKSGQYQVSDTVNTSPGYMKLSGHIIRDGRNEGALTLSGILQKSSNVGISKLVTSLKNPLILPDTLRSLGFGSLTHVDFPGEVPGTLKNPVGQFALSTLAFGYGVSVTTLQLANAFAVFGDQGHLHTPTLLKIEQPISSTEVLPAQVAQEILSMLTQVVSRLGTGYLAQVPGYSVAGKTGTAIKAVAGGYADNSYVALFEGIIPADKPRFAMVVMVDDPRGDKYYGGSVAAPVFSEVMRKVMPLLALPVSNTVAAGTLGDAS